MLENIILKCELHLQKSNEKVIYTLLLYCSTDLDKSNLGYLKVTDLQTLFYFPHSI